MIVITVEILPETEFAGAYDYRAISTHDSTRYAARSRVMETAVRNVVSQLACHADDQSLVIEYPTVVAQHRSLWAFAGIKTRDEQKRSCKVCHSPVTGTSIYCSPKCRQRASRARKQAA
jgi:hypothetical protein